MKTLKRAVPVLALVTLLIGVSAQSQTSSGTHSQSSAHTQAKQRAEKLKQACQSDVDKLCKDVTPGEGRIAACLNSKEDKLSPDCKTAWTGTKERISKKMDKAELSFRKNCGADVQKYCSDVPSGRGRLLECLNGHKDNLSASCQKFHAQLDQKLNELLS